MLQLLLLDSELNLSALSSAAFGVSAAGAVLVRTAVHSWVDVAAVQGPADGERPLPGRRDRARAAGAVVTETAPCPCHRQAVDLSDNTE